jgi:hypothetical protein
MLKALSTRSTGSSNLSGINEGEDFDDGAGVRRGR